MRFSTIAIGGFFPYDASIGYFDSVTIESVAIIFMIVSGMNFSLHFLCGTTIQFAITCMTPSGSHTFLFLFTLSMLVSLVLVASDACFTLCGPFRKGYFRNGVNRDNNRFYDFRLCNLAYLYSISTFNERIYWRVCRFNWRRHT